jgi:hypothetical protein
LQGIVCFSRTLRLEGNGDPTGFESFQMDIHHQRRWRHYERVYYMYLYDVLTDQEWSGFHAAIHESMNGDSRFSVASRDAWETNKVYFSEEFVRYVNALIEKID